jgi:hypothetical protein
LLYLISPGGGRKLTPLVIFTNISIGVDHNSKSFFIAFAFLLDQSEESYTWALNKTKDLYRRLIPTTIGLAPGAISTDYDQVLRNTILAVLPETLSLLCLWHANKNI